MRDDGSSNEERLRTGRRYRTDRTEGTSDGVFAVSLTLLILDVRPPEGGVSQLVHGLVLIAPRLGTFALSFAIKRGSSRSGYGQITGVFFRQLGDQGK